MPTYNILLMGASYGSLPGVEAFVRRPFNPSGLPARRGRSDKCRRLQGSAAGARPQGAGTTGIAKAARQGDAGPATGVDPKQYDLVGLCMQEPQYRSPGVRELLDAVAKSRVPCMSIMNMPPLPYVKRIPGLDYKALEPAYTDPRVWDCFDPKTITLNSPDPQAIRPPDGRPTNCWSRCRPISNARGSTMTKSTAILRNLKRTSTPRASTRRKARSNCRSNSKSTTRSACRLPNGRCCWPAITAASPRTACAQPRRPCIPISRRAFGLQFRLRPVRQARRQARRPGAVREIRCCRAVADAAGFGGPRVAKRRAEHRAGRQAGATHRPAEGHEQCRNRRPGGAGRLPGSRPTARKRRLSSKLEAPSAKPRYATSTSCQKPNRSLTCSHFGPRRLVGPGGARVPLAGDDDVVELHAVRTFRSWRSLLSFPASPCAPLAGGKY